MTREERYRRIAPVLLAQGKTPQQIWDRVDQDMARASAPLAQAAPPAQDVSVSAGPRYGNSKPRDDNAHLASAPYRFVPYDATAVVKAQSEATRAIDDPIEHGLSALIEVAWTAEAPLLIGVQRRENETDRGPVVPMTLPGADGATTFIIPGATLRGAIRSVAEIAGGGRLSQVNRERLFGLRDFTHAGYAARGAEGSFPVSDPIQVKAGWLRLRPGQARLELQDAEARHRAELPALDEVFAVEPCDDWYAIAPDDIGAMNILNFSGFQPRRVPPDGKTFSKLDLEEKYRAMGCWRNGTIFPNARSHRFTALPSNQRPPDAVKPDPAGALEGCLVVSGASPSGKVREYVLPKPTDATPVDIKPDTMRRFRQLNSRAVDVQLEAEGNWLAVLKAFVKNPDVRIPVFYVGDLVDQPEAGPKPFFMGLTRLFKVPHRNSFEQVLTNSGVAKPSTPVVLDDLDMVEALFGYVREPPAGTNLAPRHLARKGRVAFSTALLAPGSTARLTDEISTVMMGPKPSFAPFYLARDKDGVRDYSSAHPTIAGRKRYPPRLPIEGPQGGALAAVEAKLRQQVTRITEMQNGTPPGPKAVTRLKFLIPNADAPLRFRSEVRLLNVTPEELGLVLWALTFGGREATHRHMLGRAKPFGAGQMRVAIARLAVEANKPALKTFEAGHNVAPAPFITAFEKISHAQTDPKRRLAIAALLATADPALGQKWERAGKLDTMRVSQRVDGRTVQSFQRVRDMVKLDNYGRAAFPKPLLPME